MGRHRNKSVHQSKLSCAVCRRIQKDGVVIKTCYGCRQVYYCSVQCERDNWSEHRAACIKHCNKVFDDLVKALLADPVLESNLKLALVEESSYGSKDLVHDETAFTRQTHVVAVSMGVEPTNLTEVVSAWAFGQKWSHRGAEAMLQVNRLLSDARDRVNGGSDDHVKLKNAWAVHRAYADQKGCAANAVILAVFRDAAYDYAINVPMIIDSDTLRKAQAKTKSMSLDDLENSIENHLLDINNHIFTDTDNQLRLRLLLRKGDKQLITGALDYENLEDDPERESMKSLDFSIVRVKILSAEFLPEIQGVEDIAAREKLLADTSFPSVRDKIAALFQLCQKVA